MTFKLGKFLELDLASLRNAQILDVFQKFPNNFVMCAFILKIRKSTPLRSLRSLRGVEKSKVNVKSESIKGSCLAEMIVTTLDRSISSEFLL